MKDTQSSSDVTQLIEKVHQNFNSVLIWGKFNFQEKDCSTTQGPGFQLT